MISEKPNLRWWSEYSGATISLSMKAAMMIEASASSPIIMSFTIQHLQARHQLVIHRELDEVLRSLPTADARLIAAEEAPDEHLEVLTEQNRQDRFS